MSFAKECLTTLAAAACLTAAVSAETFTVLPPEPGVPGVNNIVKAIGCTPFEDVYFYYGFRPGETILPPCPGVPIEINRAQWMGIGIADEFGVASIVTFVPQAANGRTVLLQAGEPDTCLRSELTIFTFGE